MYIIFLKHTNNPVQLRVNDNLVELLPQKALYWPAEDLLLLSDVHLGKVTHFRREGIAIPVQALNENFRLLDETLETCRPGRMAIVGDLFHSRRNREWDLFEAWTRRYPSVEKHIILGNHDTLSTHDYQTAGLYVHPSEWKIGNITLAHQPKEKFKRGEYVISGHVHPVIHISGNGRPLRFPCFYFGQQQALLPGFGYFTGGHAITPYKGDRVIAVVNQTLVEV